MLSPLFRFSVDGGNMRKKDSLKARAIVDEVFPGYPEKDRVKTAKRLENIFKDERLAKFLEIEESLNNRARAISSNKVIPRIKPEYKMLFNNLVLLDSFIHDKDAVIELLLPEQGVNKDKILDNLVSEFSYRMRLYQMGASLAHQLKEQSIDSELNFFEARLDRLIDITQPEHPIDNALAVKNTPVALHALQVLEDVEKSADYDPNSVKDMLEKVRYYIKIEQARPAYALLTKVLNKEMHQPFALMLMAQLHLQFKDQLIRKGNSYHFMHLESEACSAAERHYDELASESYWKADDQKEQAFKLIIQALQHWPTYKDYSDEICYEEFGLRESAIDYVLKTVASKCDPDRYEYLFSEKVRARTGAFVEGEARQKTEELKADPLFDSDTDRLITQLAEEKLLSSPSIYGDISQKVCGQINAMCVANVLPAENMETLRNRYWSNLDDITESYPDLLTQLSTADQRIAKAFRQHLISTKSVNGALHFIDTELKRTDKQNHKCAVNAKLKFLEELTFHHYKIKQFEQSHQYSLTATKLLEGSQDLGIERIDYLLEKWRYCSVRSYIDANDICELTSMERVEILRQLLDLHEQHITSLLCGNREYMIWDCETYDGGGFRNFYTDPFGREENDIFSTDEYEGVDKCLSRGFITECISEVCPDELRLRANKLIDLISSRLK